MGKILIVDDEVGIRELLSEILEDEGYGIVTAEDATQAREKLVQDEIDLILLDIWMPDTDGISLLKEWQETYPSGIPPVIMMSGHATIDTAVESTKIGAIDFLEKPISLQKLLTTIKRVLQQNDEKFYLNNQVTHLECLGKSKVIQQLAERLKQIIKTNLPLLIISEPGCGAEIWAKFLHQSNTPWVTVDTPNLLATQSIPLVEKAKGGVLFIPEVATLNRLEQKGLNLILTRLQRFQVRLICATTFSLPQKVEENQFDASLQHALSSVSLNIPPLREHKDDVPEIAQALLLRMIERKELPEDRSFNLEALGALTSYDWPGNLPELENAIRTIALNALNAEIQLKDVKSFLNQYDILTSTNVVASFPLDLPLREARDAFEKLYLEHHMRLENNNMSRVAEKVGLERTHLYRKIKQLGIKITRKGDIDETNVEEHIDEA